MKIIHHAHIETMVGEGASQTGETIWRGITYEELMGAMGKLDDVPGFRHDAAIELAPESRPDVEVIQFTWEEEV